jgi:hypothetical protein
MTSAFVLNPNLGELVTHSAPTGRILTPRMRVATHISPLSGLIQFVKKNTRPKAEDQIHADILTEQQKLAHQSSIAWLL